MPLRLNHVQISGGPPSHLLCHSLHAHAVGEQRHQRLPLDGVLGPDHQDHEPRGNVADAEPAVVAYVGGVPVGGHRRRRVGRLGTLYGGAVVRPAALGRRSLGTVRRRPPSQLMLAPVQDRAARRRFKRRLVDGSPTKAGGRFAPGTEAPDDALRLPLHHDALPVGQCALGAAALRFRPPVPAGSPFCGGFKYSSAGLASCGRFRHPLLVK